MKENEDKSAKRSEIQPFFSLLTRSFAFFFFLFLRLAALRLTVFGPGPKLDSQHSQNTVELKACNPGPTVCLLLWNLDAGI